jgi:hypothetical protein
VRPDVGRVGSSVVSLMPGPMRWRWYAAKPRWARLQANGATAEVVELLTTRTSRASGRYSR